MQFDPASSIPGILTAITTAVCGWLLYDRQKSDENIATIKRDLNELRRNQDVHKVTFLDQNQTREVVRDEILSLKESHTELKIMVTSLTNQTSTINTSQEVQTEILKSLAIQIKELRGRRKGG